jgi:hypothetical protein
MLEDQNYQVLGHRHDISIAYGAAQLTVEVLCNKSIEIWADFTCTIQHYMSKWIISERAVIQR